MKTRQAGDLVTICLAAPRGPSASGRANVETSDALAALTPPHKRLGMVRCML